MTGTMTMTEHGTSELDRIEDAAAKWLVERSTGLRSNSQEQQFEEWKQADPRHFEVYCELSGVFEDIREIESLKSLVPQAKTPWWKRALVPATAVAAAVLLAVVVIPFNAIFPEGEAYSSGVAENRQIALEDGSIVTLGALTEMRVDMDDAERMVVMTEGEAFFEVASDGQRPFIVVTGNSRIQVVGTKFNVRHGSDEVKVTVAEGRVRVSVLEGEATLSSHTLDGGDELAVPQALSPAIVDSNAATLETREVEPVDVAIWRTGRFNYVDAPLGEVVEDVNRYFPGGVEIVDPKVADLRVNASFGAGQIGGFIGALESTHPVAVRRDDEGKYLISNR